MRLTTFLEAIMRLRGSFLSISPRLFSESETFNTNLKGPFIVYNVYWSDMYESASRGHNEANLASS